MSLSFLVRFYFFFTAGEAHEVFNNVLNIVENFTFSEKNQQKSAFTDPFRPVKALIFHNMLLRKRCLQLYFSEQRQVFPIVNAFGAAQRGGLAISRSRTARCAFFPALLLLIGLAGTVITAGTARTAAIVGTAARRTAQRC